MFVCVEEEELVKCLVEWVTQCNITTLWGNVIVYSHSQADFLLQVARKKEIRG